MTLIEEIDESIRLGDAFGNNANLSEVMSDAKILFQKIKSAESEIIGLFQDSKAMKSAGLISGAEISDILEMILQIYSDVNRGDYKADKINIVVKNSQKAEEEIKSIWNRYLRKEIGSQRGIVETLHILVEDTQRYMTLVNLYNTIVGSLHPGDSDILKKIDTYKTLSEKMIKELDLKPSIMRFFEKMASKNVLSLKELTPEIWKWIQENGFEDKFTIKISER